MSISLDTGGMISIGVTDDAYAPMTEEELSTAYAESGEAYTVSDITVLPETGEETGRVFTLTSDEGVTMLRQEYSFDGGTLYVVGQPAEGDIDTVSQYMDSFLLMAE